MITTILRPAVSARKGCAGVVSYTVKRVVLCVTIASGTVLSAVMTWCGAGITLYSIQGVMHPVWPMLFIVPYAGSLFHIRNASRVLLVAKQSVSIVCVSVSIVTGYFAQII